jgi:hypothetical protein
MSPLNRAVSARSFVFAVPFALAGVAGAFGGCSNLVDDLPGADGGSPSGNEDAGPISTEDAPVIIIGADGQSEDAGLDAAPNCGAEDASFGAPNDLECTGLYASFTTKTLAPGVQAYDPGLHLWADGAAVARFISLPVGGKIDTSDMNEWQFPVGTKTWQEFKISGQRVETRYYWKRGDDDWVRGTYVWSAGESSAVYTTTGVTDVGGSSYDIPPVADCDTCHSGRIDRVLGVEAVSLAQASATGVTLASLVSAGTLTQPPTGSLTIPDDGTGLAAPALAWMHANCGTSCHSASPGATAASTGLLLRLEIAGSGSTTTLGDVAHTNAYTTSVNITPQLSPYSGEGWHRITPNDTFDGGIGTSLIPFMAGSRNDPELQMPPIDTATPDIADLAALKHWITNGTFPVGSYPP